MEQLEASAHAQPLPTSCYLPGTSSPLLAPLALAPWAFPVSHLHPHLAIAVVTWTQGGLVSGEVSHGPLEQGMATAAPPWAVGITCTKQATEGVSNSSTFCVAT